jgi:hypothetical protein
MLVLSFSVLDPSPTYLRRISAARQSRCFPIQIVALQISTELLRCAILGWCFWGKACVDVNSLRFSAARRLQGRLARAPNNPSRYGRLAY